MHEYHPSTAAGHQFHSPVWPKMEIVRPFPWRLVAVLGIMVGAVFEIIRMLRDG